MNEILWRNVDNQRTVHCVKKSLYPEFFSSIFFLHFLWKSLHSVRMQDNTDLKNTEYGFFSRNDISKRLKGWDFFCSKNIFVKLRSFELNSQYCYHLKSCVRYIFASLFLGLNESTCQIKKNVFYFTSKHLFVLGKMKF